MSIQIVDGANPRSRDEVAERIGVLVGAFVKRLANDDEVNPDVEQLDYAIKFAARDLFFGLVGTFPNDAEMKVMSGQ